MLNKQRFTPFMTALAFGNHKCAEEMLSGWPDGIDFDTKDVEGNSIFHICARYNNTMSLKLLTNKYFVRTAETILAKNSLDETVLHVACQFGNLEVIKIILDKLFQSTSVSASGLLYNQNKDGRTCFHIACANGFTNVVQYFLKDKKIIQLLDYTDNSLNTSLHLATQFGHSSVVSMLLEFNLDLDARNEDGASALDLSCRKGFFEISKLLIGKYSIMTRSHGPLHTACQEGAHEVVQLLLNKG
jgi:ankyrin repeat protein